VTLEEPTLRHEPPLDPELWPGPRARINLLEALRRNLLVLIIPIVLLVAIAIAIGLARKPTYTSEARLNVGGMSLNVESIPGYTTAVGYLAIAYARAIDATQVATPVANQLHMSPTAVAAQVSATPIQGSPVIAVDGTSKNPAQAVALANAASTALVNYAVQLNSGNAVSNQLLQRYRNASHALQLADARLEQAPPRSRQQRAAQVTVDLARLRLQTNAALYQQSEAGQATANLVQKLAPAAPATSDRSSVLQQYAAGGLIAGLLIGVGLAAERMNRLMLRRMRRIPRA
jgi:uncharacterized protein involved in exopolysaccharide biosynthesis